MLLSSSAVQAPVTSLVPNPNDRAASLLAAADLILPDLVAGRTIDAAAVRAAMAQAFGGSDSEGLWAWKDAYEAGEAAQVLFLRRFGPALRAKSPAAQLAVLAKIATLLPTQTRRSQESQALQQFSTPIGLSLVAGLAAAIAPEDVVLEPSAGTGLLAAFAQMAGGALVLNELSDTRAGLLKGLFPGAPVSRHDAAYIHDLLDPQVRPSVVLMNPPFSVAAHVEGRVVDAALRHVSSALARLVPGGRLVAITGGALSPANPAWRDAFVRLQERSRVVFTAAVDGHVYARHGTTVETRLTVIDRVPTDDVEIFPASPGVASDLATLLDWVTRLVPPRGIVTSVVTAGTTASPASARMAGAACPAAARSLAPVAADAAELAYDVIDAASAQTARLTEALYEPYRLQTIRIPGAAAHPTPLVQSAAMASVAPPAPIYRPHLPPRLVSGGLLSDAQLETVIQAGEAHSGILAGSWCVDDTFDVVSAAPDDAEGAMRFRRGFMLGDGTGAGKGRQVAGVILDNWLKGRRRALWVSKSDTLIEDAQRDWSALGQEKLLVTPLSRFPQGKAITLDEGVLFATYATLRTDEKQDKVSRVRQIVDWLGADFDGVIVFDESHAMQNAGGNVASGRGNQAPSQQGRAGLRLQHALPDARILYVSATGATTVQNLAYAQRLGLWGGADFPFGDRAEFVAAIETGGVAAMEVLARDLKALGLYTARSLSYDGVEYELVEHVLTPEQIRIYDAYAGAFQIIHANLGAALEATGVTGSNDDGRAKTLNAQAKSAARSAFESSKQRFFNHLICAMKTPTLIHRIDGDLAAGHACVIQIVSTGEALMERRIAQIPAEDWGDVQIDITPREYVLDYLAHAFPTQLYEPFTDGEGNLFSRAVWRDGQPVRCREAEDRRDALIERLAALPAVQGALDQIVQRFGADHVAEVTGRARRIVRVQGDPSRLVVERRPAGANLVETQAFMDDAKRILVFSEAGGTGRSYHADLGAKNRRLRVHYLLEAGWKADAAIQGLGRTNRTHQAQPPLFRPVTTDVRGEKRFTSTIARRLDTLGAITRGQRQTGGQGLFRASDNLESDDARAALRHLYMLIIAGKVEGCSLGCFEDATGLSLMTPDGAICEILPPITQFLNRMLALRIDLQNRLFDVFDGLLNARIEAAMAAGTYDLGVETVVAESLKVLDRSTLYVHPATGAETQVFTVARADRAHPMSLDKALASGGELRSRFLVNARSGHAAVQLPSPGLTLDDGTVERRVRLLRPLETRSMAFDALAATRWEAVDEQAFAQAWSAEVDALPEFIESTFHVVTGLLLPIWRRLPAKGCRVYRLQTDDGERVIGRLVSESWVAQALQLPATAPAPAPQDAWNAVLQSGTVLRLADGLSVRRVLAMGLHRVELTGFTDAMVARMKAMGLTGEIIAWTLRLFIPLGDAGPTILAAILERHPITRTVEKTAA